ncbi:MAG: hypothetical protein AB7F09_09845 [Parvibaculaceae bacterium]
MIRKLATVLGLGLAVLVLYGLQKTRPGYGEITSPIAVSGKAGEKLSARNFELAVTKIRLARQIKLSAFGKDRHYSTSGVWAVVEAEAAARNESITLTSAAWLGPDGVRYDASERLTNAPGLLTAQRLEPGLPMRTLMIFEFPEREWRGGAILVAPTPFLPLENEMHIAADLSANVVIHPTLTLARGSSPADWSIVTE